jgi:hypothetical protein
MPITHRALRIPTFTDFVVEFAAGKAVLAPHYGPLAILSVFENSNEVKKMAG